SLEGLEVVLCEKSDQVGGTAATSAGSLWIPENVESRSIGLQDSIDDAAKYLDSLIGDDPDAGLRTTYLESGPVALPIWRRAVTCNLLPPEATPTIKSTNQALLSPDVLSFPCRSTVASLIASSFACVRRLKNSCCSAG
ncbi:MAG: FAD-binding protein, partial [Xanthobacteraceae bacterium]